MHVNSILNSKLVSHLSYIKILGFCLKDLAFELTHSLVSEAMPFFFFFYQHKALSLMLVSTNKWKHFKMYLG